MEPDHKPRRPTPRPSHRPRDRAELVAAISYVADDQLGLITRAELEAQGISPRRHQRLVEDGLLRRVYRGVYALGATHLSRNARLLAATLSAGPGAFIARQSGAGLLDLASHPRGPIQLLVLNHRPRRQPGLELKPTVHLPDGDTTEVNGIPGTAAARTLLDAAPFVPTQQLRAMLDRSVGINLFDYSAIERVLRERPREPGCAALREAVARLDETSGRNRSELERMLIELIKDSDIPNVMTNVVLSGMEVDVHFPGTRAVIEADGREFHITPQQRADDIAKMKALAALGFVVRRFDWASVNYQPELTLVRAEQFRLANLAPPVARLRR